MEIPKRVADPFRMRSVARRCARLFVPSLLILGLTACTIIGPDTLSSGRPAYNEVIGQTNREQSLAWIVKRRYGVTNSMLSVASVTANVTVTGNVGGQAGIGSAADFAGNLVPFSGALTYEENPTISYQPVQGEEHMRALFASLPLDLLVRLFNGSALDAGDALTMLVSRINQVNNPGFIVGSRPDDSKDFSELAKIMGDLRWADAVQFVEAADEDKQFYLWIHDYHPTHTADVKRLLTLLAAGDVSTSGADIFLPVSDGPRPPTARHVAIQTRSVSSLTTIFSSIVDVPDEDIASGAAATFPKTGLAGAAVTIKRSAARPDNAMATTKFRGWWFYIDDTDIRSKTNFSLFDSLMSVILAESGGAAQAAPVLTVPVN